MILISINNLKISSSAWWIGNCILAFIQADLQLRCYQPRRWLKRKFKRAENRRRKKTSGLTWRRRQSQRGRRRAWERPASGTTLVEQDWISASRNSPAHCTEGGQKETSHPDQIQRHAAYKLNPKEIELPNPSPNSGGKIQTRSSRSRSRLPLTS